MAADRKLRKVTLNLFDEDCSYLQTHYGHGWSTEVRDRIHAFVAERQRLQRDINNGFGEHTGEE